MMDGEKRLRLCRVLLALNLCFIWGNSLLPGSVSGALSDWVKELIAMLFSGSALPPAGGGLLRKIAHFAEFTALGMLLAWHFAMMGKTWPRALVWGVTAACVDETIQRFVPDRGPGLKDVCIDSCGVLTGILLCHLGYFVFRQIKTNQRKT